MNNTSKMDDLISICQKVIEEYNLGNFTIEYLKNSDQNKPPSGNACLFSKRIQIKYDWNDLNSNNPDKVLCAVKYFYYIVGHELGHKDKEPKVLATINIALLILLAICCCSAFAFGICVIIVYFIVLLIAMLLFDSKIKFFSCHMREVRADYCGILFTLKCLEKDGKPIDRDELVEEIFDYMYRCNPDGFKIGDSSHPSNLNRKRYLLYKNQADRGTDISKFDKVLINAMSKEYMFGFIRSRIPLFFAFSGRLLKLQEKNFQ